MMTHLDLCTGVGGFTLAAHWAGFRTIGFSEIDPYCSKLLADKFPLVTNYGDLRTADFSGLRESVDVLSAGAPCQPASLAGKRRGAKDNRWLWGAVLDVVESVRPTWAVFENPPGILTLDEFDGVLLRLGTLGYQVRAFGVSANSVGAKHLRNRIFLVAHAAQGGVRQPRPGSWGSGLRGQEPLVAHTGCEPPQEWARSGPSGPAELWRRGSGNGSTETLAHAQHDGCAPAQDPGSTGPRIQSDSSGCRTQQPPGPGCGQDGPAALGDAPGARLQAGRPGADWAFWDPAWGPQPGRRSDALADSACGGRNGRRQPHPARSGVQWESLEPAGCSETLPDAAGAGLPVGLDDRTQPDSGSDTERGVRWLPEPEFLRVAHGIPERLDRPWAEWWSGLSPLVEGHTIKNRANRLKALGNAVVPQVAYPFFEAIAQIEKSKPPTDFA